MSNTEPRRDSLSDEDRNVIAMTRELAAVGDDIREYTGQRDPGAACCAVLRRLQPLAAYLAERLAAGPR